MSVIDEIKAKIDIVDLISSYTPVKKAGVNYKALCPFHGEKTPSFMIYTDSQSWHCFGQCNEGGDIFGFVMKKEGYTFAEALQFLAQKAGITLEKYQPAKSKEQQEANRRLYAILKEATEFYQARLPNSPAEAYVQKRGLTPATAHTFGLGYAPDEWAALTQHLTLLGFEVEDILTVGLAVKKEETGRVYDRFRDRFMIPIRDDQGRTVGFGARAMTDDRQPKYLNSPQTLLFDKSALLFGYDAARRAIRETETAVIVEGYLDVIQAHQAGFHNVVGTMGTALTNQHMKLLGKHAERLVLALDTDAAGIKATLRGLEVAREELDGKGVLVVDVNGVLRQAGQLKVDVRVLQLPFGKDPDDFIRAMPDQWAKQVAESSQPLAEYLIDSAVTSLPPDASVFEREKLAHELLPLLMTTEDQVADLHNLQHLSLKLQLDEKAMVQWASNQVLPPTQPHKGGAKRSEKKEFTESNGKRKPKHTGTLLPFSAQYSSSVKTRTLEQLCLAALIRAPYRIYEANRVLREVAADDADLLYQPLQPEDFNHFELQEIFRLVEAANTQVDIDPFNYMLDYVDSILREVIDEILLEPLEVYVRRAGQMPTTELRAVQKEQEHHLTKRSNDDFPLLLIQLRQQHMLRRAEQINFALRESKDYSDDEDYQNILVAYSDHVRALRQLQAAHQKTTDALGMSISLEKSRVKNASYE